MPLFRGATRLVLLVGAYAFKVPNPATWRSFLNGLLANMQEREFSALNDPRLCPVLIGLPGGFLVVMPRTHPLTPEQFAGIRRDDDLHELVEHKRCSYGWLAGRVVAVDYG